MSGRRDRATYAALTAFQEQRIAVLERDEYACAFERAIQGLPPNETHFGGERIVEHIGPVAWVRCAAGGALQTAHIHRRHKLGHTLTDDGIELVYHPLVALAGCPDCHRKFDSRQHRDQVRVPAERIRLARLLIDHTLQAAKDRGEFVVEVDLSNL